MLVSLSVRNIVLIDSLELPLREGFGVLTGETGAGKSVLLASLSLATGRRADPAYLRPGASEGRVDAVFSLDPDHPACEYAETRGIETEGELILRRTLRRDGRSRAFVNDTPVTVRFLDALGERLVLVHGQHDRRGLLDPGHHLDLLDAFGQLEGLGAEVARRYRHWKDARRRYADRSDRVEERMREVEEDRARLEELHELAPDEGEHETLAARRELLVRSADVAAALSGVEAALGDTPTGPGLRSRLVGCVDSLRDLPLPEGALLDLRETLDRVLIEMDEAESALDRVRDDEEFDPSELERVEQRLFALRQFARRCNVSPGELVGLRTLLAESLESLEAGEGEVTELAKEAQNARSAFESTAARLGAARRQAGTGLDARVGDELVALRMNSARLKTAIEDLPSEKWGARGGQRVRFRLATMEKSEPGPLDRIASGGELSRFLLAVHVALAGSGSPLVLVFDEIDAGVGGAVSDAVGQRLQRLSEGHQVLAVTHQPQVAARAGHHWRVARRGDAIAVEALDPEARVDEIARMLAASDVTDEAKAAAKRLLQESRR